MRIANPFYTTKATTRHTRTPREVPCLALGLFSGFGGFSLGLESAGMRTAAFCEIDPFWRRVLARHWPHIPVYDDIRSLTARRLHHDNISTIDIICGGYPGQSFCMAGKQRGNDDPRHLWPEMYRLIRELRPRWVICENVTGHIELGLDAVLTDLDAADYAATQFVIPACAVGAPHRRDRIWIVAHAAGVGLPRAMGPQGTHSPAQLPPETLRWELPAPFTVGSNDGIPYRMERTHALGNAVIPLIPGHIGRAIIAYESRQHCGGIQSW